MLWSFTQTLVAGSILVLGTVVLLRLSLMTNISSAFGAVAFAIFVFEAGWFVSGQSSTFDNAAIMILLASSLLATLITYAIERHNDKKWRAHCNSAIGLTKG